MKKSFNIIAVSLITVLFVSCQTKEEKAAEFIKNELSKTLYDFESYQPIETTVKEAKQTMYNDSSCWLEAATLAYGMNTTSEYLNEMNTAKEHMDIWDKPTYYSSTYSDNQYYKYKEEFEENFEKSKKAYEICKFLAAELKCTYQI